MADAFGDIPFVSRCRDYHDLRFRKGPTANGNIEIECPQCMKDMEQNQDIVQHLCAASVRYELHERCLHDWLNTANGESCPSCRAIIPRRPLNLDHGDAVEEPNTICIVGLTDADLENERFANLANFPVGAGRWQPAKLNIPAQLQTAGGTIGSLRRRVWRHRTNDPNPFPGPDGAQWFRFIVHVGGVLFRRLTPDELRAFGVDISGSLEDYIRFMGRPQSLLEGTLPRNQTWFESRRVGGKKTGQKGAASKAKVTKTSAVSKTNTAKKGGVVKKTAKRAAKKTAKK